jgi:hypothetical protein
MSHVSPSYKNTFLTMQAAILLFLPGGGGNICRTSRTSIKQPQRERKRKISRLAIMKSETAKDEEWIFKKECIGEVSFITIITIIIISSSSIFMSIFI